MKLTRLVPAAIAAVALLAGCNPTGGTALIVGEERFSETQVDAIVEGCAEALGTETNQIRRQGVVGTLLLGGIFDAMGLPSTDEEIVAMGEQQVPGTADLMAVEACEPLAVANVKTSLLSQVDPQLISAAAGGVEVQLNPRYGKWLPGTAQLLDPSGSLSVPSVAFQ